MQTNSWFRKKHLLKDIKGSSFMETVGQILKNERVKQKKTLEKVNRSTHIPLVTLKAIEADNFKYLPSDPYIKGFIKIYSEYLGLDSDKLVAIYRRDAKIRRKTEIIHQSRLLSRYQHFWTPKVAITALISTVVSLFFLYLVVQLKNFFGTPTLSLESPIDNQEINDQTILVKGKTSKGTTVYINDKLIDVDKEGQFSYQLKLFTGENIIVVSAVNRHEKKQTKIIKVKVIDNKD